MRVMMLMIPRGYERAPVGDNPPAEAVAAMMKYNTALQEAGVLLTLDGLRPPAEGVRVVVKDGKQVVTHGPFPDTMEALGGFWILKVASMEETIGWGLRCPSEGEYTLELRRMQELEDFSDDAKAIVADFAEKLRKG